jgi:hypothetical protein
MQRKLVWPTVILIVLDVFYPLPACVSSTGDILRGRSDIWFRKQDYPRAVERLERFLIHERTWSHLAVVLRMRDEVTHRTQGVVLLDLGKVVGKKRSQRKFGGRNRRLDIF